MQNKINDDILEVLIKDEKIAETIHKIFSGYYVTDRERKDAMKSSIELYGKHLKMNAKTVEDIQRIDNQIYAVKVFIENLKEVNY